MLVCLTGSTADQTQPSGQHTNRLRPSIPGSVSSCDLYGLSREEAVLDEQVDVLTEVRQPAAMADRSKVEQRHHQGGREALQALSGPPFTLQCLQVGEASSASQSTAPHQTVAQDGPLEELAEERTTLRPQGLPDTSYKQIPLQQPQQDAGGEPTCNRNENVKANKLKKNCRFTHPTLIICHVL